MTPGFGKPKYGKETANFTKFFKLKDGSNVYRIIPPIKSQEVTGRWAIYHGVHFGYEGVSRKEPGKGQIRTFKCVQEKNYQGMILAVCPECEAIQGYKEKLDSRINSLKQAGKSAEEIAQMTVAYTSFLSSHRGDYKWYINVMNQAGEFGVLLISNKLKKQLETAIGEVQAQDIDPIDVNQGVWFNFKRVGKGFDVPDTLEVVREPIPGMPGATKVKLAALSAEQCNAALAQCADLLEVVTVIGVDQIQMLVQSGGDPETVDRIFALSNKRDSSATAQPPVTVAPVRVSAPVSAPTFDDAAAHIAALEAQLAQARSVAAPVLDAAPVAKVTTVAAPVSVVLPAGVNDEDDFLSRFNLK